MIKKLVIAGGCFWGMEDLFRNQPGVVDTDVGYSGGKNYNPSYEFHPGHAEAVMISYDEAVTTTEGLLDYFFRIHDPTTINRQGNDIGDSYRSVIFYADDQQLEAAKDSIDRATELWKGGITTTLEPLEMFHLAEDYHQDYLKKNPGGYTCHFERIFN